MEIFPPSSPFIDKICVGNSINDESLISMLVILSLMCFRI